MTSSSPPPERCVAVACLGRLGRWGNQVFQYACCALAAEAHGAKLLLPPDWPGRAVLAEAAAAESLHADFEAGLPLCADRPLLSHAGWRAWASSREPLASAAQHGTLSGRQVRRLVPQVNASVLREAGCCSSGDDADCAAVLAAPHAWWGWYAFDSSAYAPRRSRFAQLLAPAERVRVALDVALSAARRGADGAPRPLLGVHVRCGEGFTPLSAAESATPAASPAEDAAGEAEDAAGEAWTPPARGGLTAAASSTTGMWRDTGIFWAAPFHWYADWLQRTLAAWSSGPMPAVLLCSDDPGAALQALQSFGARTLAELAGADAYSALVEVCGGGDDGAALADWFALCRCDALAVSNSTFSFSAAMLAAHAAHAAPGTARSGFVAVRPDPHSKALTAFDPWSAPSTLKLASGTAV